MGTSPGVFIIEKIIEKRQLAVIGEIISGVHGKFLLGIIAGIDHFDAGIEIVFHHIGTIGLFIGGGQGIVKFVHRSPGISVDAQGLKTSIGCSQAGLRGFLPFFEDNIDNGDGHLPAIEIS